MPVIIICPTCASRIKVPSKIARSGRAVNCPKCKTPFVVPTPSATPAIQENTMPKEEDAESSLIQHHRFQEDAANKRAKKLQKVIALVGRLMGCGMLLGCFLLCGALVMITVSTLHGNTARENWAGTAAWVVVIGLIVWWACRYAALSKLEGLKEKAIALANNHRDAAAGLEEELEFRRQEQEEKNPTCPACNQDDAIVCVGSEVVGTRIQYQTRPRQIVTRDGPSALSKIIAVSHTSETVPVEVPIRRHHFRCQFCGYQTCYER